MPFTNEKFATVPIAFSNLINLTPLVRFRFQDDETTEWASWVITPAIGYLETGRYGPFLTKDVACCEIQTKQVPDESSKQMLRDLGFEVVSDQLFALHRI